MLRDPAKLAVRQACLTASFAKNKKRKAKSTCPAHKKGKSFAFYKKG
jgi:hypothetical protein